MMKLSFLLALGALACAGSVKAAVNEEAAIQQGKAIGISFWQTFDGQIDPEHVPLDQDLIRGFQEGAVICGAETSQEIDQYVNIAWHQMYLKLKLLVSVQGHRPA